METDLCCRERSAARCRRAPGDLAVAVRNRHFPLAPPLRAAKLPAAAAGRRLCRSPISIRTDLNSAAKARWFRSWRTAGGSSILIEFPAVFSPADLTPVDSR